MRTLKKLETKQGVSITANLLIDKKDLSIIDYDNKHKELSKEISKSIKKTSLFVAKKENLLISLEQKNNILELSLKPIFEGIDCTAGIDMEYYYKINKEGLAFDYSVKNGAFGK